MHATSGFVTPSSYVVRRTSGFTARCKRASAGRWGRVCGAKKGAGVLMLRPPPGNREIEPPATAGQIGPPNYKWDPEYPGTLKPGSVEDNYPLRKVLASDVYENMVYEEMDLDERTAVIFEPEEDLLEWLAKTGRLIVRGKEDGEIEKEVEKVISGITEEDLEFGDEDSKMIAYYSKQGEGAGVGSGSDFGGFSESSGGEGGAGF